MNHLRMASSDGFLKKISGEEMTDGENLVISTT